MDFNNKVRNIMQKLINKYDLEIEEMDERNLLLIGDTFAVGITYDIRDGVVISYYTNNEENELTFYFINYYILQKMDKSDRDQGHWPVDGFEERVEAELRVVTSVLDRHWRDLLRGDIKSISQVQANVMTKRLTDASENVILHKYF